MMVGRSSTTEMTNMMTVKLFLFQVLQLLNFFNDGSKFHRIEINFQSYTWLQLKKLIDR